VPAPARAQSDWARGDAAYKRNDWSAAESLYSRRAKGKRVPSGVLTNLATVRARRAPGDSVVEQQLANLAARDDASGRMAGYNLGTLYGQRHDVDRALAELRRALERAPDDADARWNYELMEREKRAGQSPQQPQQQPNAPQQGANQPPPQQPNPHAGQGQPQQPSPNGSSANSPETPPPAAPGMQQPMTKQQAERLLGSLGDLERLEQQNRRRARATREKKGKDW
jgi:tetratricopeptide (TPR) repeat protein